jgi:Replicase family/Primase C terminal 1 (PriCT-1)
MNPLQVFRGTLPARPNATDDFSRGLWPVDRIRALEKRYIEFNGPRLMRWAAFDVDRPGGAYDWQFREAPTPNITVENPENGHAHLLYSLVWPVLKTDSASYKAVRYAGAVEAGLRDKLDADPSYSALTCKNPLHSAWRVETWQETLYDLDWLADYVDLTRYSDRRRHLPPVGLGRNCTLFENLRHWAYTAIRRAGWPDLETWRGLVLAQAVHFNAFPTPLPYRELISCAKSIAMWTWERFTPESFSQIQRARIRQRWGDQVEQRRRHLMHFMRVHPDYSLREVSRRTGIPFESVRRLIRGGSLLIPDMVLGHPWEAMK